MFNFIKQWFHKRKMYRALGIKGSFLKKGNKWSSSGVALKELERLDTECAKWLYAALKLRSANKQQPTAPCCKDLGLPHIRSGYVSIGQTLVAILLLNFLKGVCHENSH